MVALKQTALHTGEEEPIRLPPPGIETLSPIMVTEGSPPLTLTIRGFNFFRRSQV